MSHLAQPTAVPPALPEDAVCDIRAVGLRKTYGTGDAAVHALRDVSVAFARGQLTAIMGPSGSGKSTLMHCLAGLDDPTAGSIQLAGQPVTGLTDKQVTQLRRDRIGFIFQQFNLLPMLTAEENITLPLDLAGRRPDPAWLKTVVTAVGLAGRLAHRPAEMSGGQQQRVAVARALLAKPSVIFADEPTGNLDSRASAEVLKLLRGCVDEFGQTIVMVTHDPTAAAIADRVIFLADGGIVQDIAAPTVDTIMYTMRAISNVEDRDDSEVASS